MRTIDERGSVFFGKISVRGLWMRAECGQDHPMDEKAGDAGAFMHRFFKGKAGDFIYGGIFDKASHAAAG